MDGPRVIRRTGMLFLLVGLESVFGCTGLQAQVANTSDRAEATEAVSGVLDALHHNASIADAEPYFDLFAPDAWFLGTDGTERWTLEEFRAFADPYFERGQGWTYTLSEGRRQIDFSEDGSVAWFDEMLDNESLGECRGSGVLVLTDGAWKIAQYNLTILVPNEVATDVVAIIRAHAGG